MTLKYFSFIYLLNWHSIFVFFIRIISIIVYNKKKILFHIHSLLLYLLIFQNYIIKFRMKNNDVKIKNNLRKKIMDGKNP